MPHQDHRHSEGLPLGDELLDIGLELVERLDVGATTFGLAESALVECQHVDPGLGECGSDVFVATGVLTDAVDEQHRSSRCAAR